MKNRIEWNIYDDSKLDISLIESTEKQIGVSFPESYKKCVLKYHGATPVQDLFNVEGTQRVFGEFLGFDENDDETLLSYYIMETNEVTGTIPKEVIPFANDPSGNYICFDYKNDKKDPEIVFLNLDKCISLEIVNDDWDEYGINIDEYESIDDAITILQRRSLQFIAKSFDDFLNMLYEE